jgi:hypothetical protein
MAEMQLPPLDVAIERELRLGRLRRLIAKRASELAVALGDAGPKVIALVELLDVYRQRREVGSGPVRALAVTSSCALLVPKRARW